MMSLRSLVVIFALCLILGSSVWGRAEFSEDPRKDSDRSFVTVQYALCNAAHRVGNIRLGIQNNGTFGTGFSEGGGADFFTGWQVPSCEFPKGSSIDHLFAGAFWIGAIVGRDTLVSVGADGWSFVRELKPDIAPFGYMMHRSILDPDKPRFEGAVSEEDYICVYTDTFITGIDADAFGQRHMPLNVEIKQSSYAWSYSYAEDFVLFDYRIKNIGTRLLENVYMGFYVDADVGFDDGTHYMDDIAGFLPTMNTKFHDCEFLDTINVAWTADADGDLKTPHPSPDLTAMRIIRTPATKLNVSFNWWISNSNSVLDFGPREKAGVGQWMEDFRDFGTGGLGTPEGDRNKYYIMRNGEFDYDQAWVASIQTTDPLWMLPLQEGVDEWADGLDTRYLLSFGPFDIAVGQSLPLSFAYLGGEGLHTWADNVEINLPMMPHRFYDSLHFEDLALNSTWAEKVYDNPGIDTDGDGYRGEFRTCEINKAASSPWSDRDADYQVAQVEQVALDTDWYRGDGVPDFRGAAPPPAPVFWLSSDNGRLTIRINGLRSETARDLFTRERDFEGYNIYIARDNRRESFQVISSYDREDYNIFEYKSNTWELIKLPMELADLREYFNDPDLDPLSYSRVHPYIVTDTTEHFFYFEPQGYNVSEIGLEHSIYKLYPDQPRPSILIADSARPDELTPDGYLKYYEYGFVIENLLPTVEYLVNVTAFDYGSPEFGVGVLETSPTVGYDSAYPMADANVVAESNLEVLVYPNPYRVDASYRPSGFEGRIPDRPEHRQMEIHFANIPAKCTISIYSLDGDLVRIIDHDVDPSIPEASHETWDLITRNTQLATSGLYYFTVESEGNKTHIGKLVIIM
ncbi:MAG: hypothetical protein KOO62_10660 [candidate division Zixibacteria bacterium]|nr:hypothetical protein [candidate division Zixibacteria bacterium]